MDEYRKIAAGICLSLVMQATVMVAQDTILAPVPARAIAPLPAVPAVVPAANGLRDVWFIAGSGQFNRFGRYTKSADEIGIDKSFTRFFCFIIEHAASRCTFAFSGVLRHRPSLFQSAIVTIPGRSPPEGTFWGARNGRFIPFPTADIDILGLLMDDLGPDLEDRMVSEFLRAGGGMIIKPSPHVGISIGLDYYSGSAFSLVNGLSWRMSVVGQMQ